MFRIYARVIEWDGVSVRSFRGNICGIYAFIDTKYVENYFQNRHTTNTP